jgi:hypothetical protein
MQKPIWDVEENIGFVKIKSQVDSLEYKVYDVGTDEEKQQVADTLAKARRDINKLLFTLCRNPELWITKKIAIGIFLMFDIHLPCIYDNIDYILNDNSSDEVKSNYINKECKEIDKLFSIQEMTPNEHGIIGLNKPKILGFIKNNKIKFEVAKKRSFHLTVRNIVVKNKKIINVGKIHDYNTKVIPLVLHEITHTVCNDNHWKEDNHMYPFNKYHSFLKKIYYNNNNKNK